MELNLEQRLRMMVGELVIQNLALQMENEKLKVQAAANSKPEPETKEFGVPVDNGTAKPV